MGLATVWKAIKTGKGKYTFGKNVLGLAIFADSYLT